MKGGLLFTDRTPSKRRKPEARDVIENPPLLTIRRQFPRARPPPSLPPSPTRQPASWSIP